MNRKSFVSLLFVAALVALAGVPAAAKSSKKITLAHPASLNGTKLDQGLYEVSWVTHSPEATVTFSKPKKGPVVATAEGKLVEREAPFTRNSVVYDRHPDGTYSIIEIRFAGSNQVIVFSNPGPSAELVQPQSPAAAALVRSSASAKSKIKFVGKASIPARTAVIAPAEQLTLRGFQPNFKNPVIVRP